MVFPSHTFLALFVINLLIYCHLFDFKWTVFVLYDAEIGVPSLGSLSNRTVIINIKSTWQPLILNVSCPNASLILISSILQLIF